MIPRFESRVRGFAIDTSGVAIVVILSIPIAAYNLILAYVLSVAAFVGFYFVPYFFISGQSIGKRFEKTKIVNLDGSKPLLIKVLGREIFKVSASILTGGIYLIVAYFFLSEKKESRTIHDFIFKTKVISLKQEVPKNNDDPYLKHTATKDKWGF
ncbi:MAG: RDD family protein [Acholeplasmataceae bacterium]|jgi:uncharacterized RDD family membrane protein YckC|nr:RDD family protein [Acholeplasmataceae bacterium]